MTPEKALFQLLQSLFGPEQLRRWIRFDMEVSVIVADLPGPTASTSQLVSTVVELLVAHGLADQNFFARLREERSGRAAEIERVAVLWAADGAAATTSAPSSRTLANERDARVVMSGGVYAPGSTLNVQGGLHAGDKHEVHHHHYGASPPQYSRAEAPEDGNRMHLTPGTLLDLKPLEPPGSADLFWHPEDPDAGGPHAVVEENSLVDLVVRMRSLAFGSYLRGVYGGAHVLRGETPADAVLRIPLSEVESATRSLHGESFELRLTRPLKYQERTRRWEWV